MRPQDGNGGVGRRWWSTTFLPLASTYLRFEACGAYPSADIAQILARSRVRSRPFPSDRSRGSGDPISLFRLPPTNSEQGGLDPLARSDAEEWTDHRASSRGFRHKLVHPVVETLPPPSHRTSATCTHAWEVLDTRLDAHGTQVDPFRSVPEPFGTLVQAKYTCRKGKTVVWDQPKERIGRKSKHANPAVRLVWIGGEEPTDGTNVAEEDAHVKDKRLTHRGSNHVGQRHQGTGVRKWKDDKHVKQSCPKRMVNAPGGGHNAAHFSTSPKSVPMVMKAVKDGHPLSTSNHSSEIYYSPNASPTEKEDESPPLLYHDAEAGAIKDKKSTED